MEKRLLPIIKHQMVEGVILLFPMCRLENAFFVLLSFFSSFKKMASRIVMICKCIECL
jgi:hypothetical protein